MLILTHHNQQKWKYLMICIKFLISSSKHYQDKMSEKTFHHSSLAFGYSRDRRVH